MDKPELGKLDIFMHEYVNHDSMLVGINNAVIKQDLLPGNCYTVVEISTDTSSWQQIPTDEDAFTLNAPVAGGMKDILTKRVCFLKRVCIGYTAAGRMAEDYQVFKKQMDLIVLQSLTEIKQIRGYGPDEITTGSHYFSMALRAQPECYFLDNEKYAAVELRISSDCLKTNIIKG